MEFKDCTNQKLAVVASNNRHKLSVLYTNADNLINKRNNSTATLSCDNPDIICITESLPKNPLLAIQESELQLTGYNCHSNINEPSCHRGVVIYTKKILNAVSINIMKNNSVKEHVCCKMVLQDNFQLHVICIYRSPNSTDENNDKINNLIDVATNLKGDILIMGDFNYPKLNWQNITTPHNSNHCASKFLENIQNCFLHQVVDFPTHCRPNQNSTLIDLIFTSNDHAISNLSFAAPLGKSHHKILKFSYHTKDLDTQDMKQFMYHKANYQEMRLSLQSIDWAKEFNNNDTEISWNVFLNIINSHISKFIPIRKSSCFNKKSSAWVNNDVLLKIKSKNKSYHKYLRTKDPTDYKTYVKHRNQSKNHCRKAMKSFEKSLAKEVKSNPKAFFKYAKEKLQYSKNIPDLVDEDKIVEKDEKKAELFNDFFCSVFTNESAKIPIHDKKCNSELDDVQFIVENVEKRLSILDR